MDSSDEKIAKLFEEIEELKVCITEEFLF